MPTFLIYNTHTMKKYLFITLLLTLISLPAYSQPKNHFFYEKDYQNYWCSANNGKTEVILNDKARVDCLTLNYAVEVDFAPKWAESIGQSLYYASVTKKSTGRFINFRKSNKRFNIFEKITNSCKTA